MTQAPRYEPHDDPERLKRMYWGAGMSQREIAQAFNVSRSKIRRAMERYDIETRAPGGSDYKRKASYYTDTRGYEQWYADGTSVRVHTLVAIANGGDPHRLFGLDGEVVHHKNEVPWDNRPENLQTMSHSDHGKHHAEMGDFEPPNRTIKYSEEELLSWISAFVDEIGFVPSATDAADWPGPTPQTYRNRFGSWRNAVRKAGYTPRGATDE